MEHQAALREVIEDAAAIRRIIQELEPPLTELSRARTGFKTATQRYSDEVDCNDEIDPLREEALFEELARSRRHWDDTQIEATTLLQGKLHRTIEDQAALRPIIQELEPFITEQLAEAKAEHNNVREQYIHEDDPLRKEALSKELNRWKDLCNDIVRQATTLLQGRLRRFLPPPVQQQSEQPGEDDTLATASTGPDDDQAMDRPTESRQTDDQSQVTAASSPESTFSDTWRSPRSSSINTGPLTRRTIRFSEVHTEGQRCWCRIIERDGHYYIFKCKEPGLDHGKLFNAKDPIKGARKHLQLHSGLTANNKNVWKYFAYRVVDCNEARRMENQTIVDRFLEEQKYKRQREKVSVYDLDGYPQPGKVYMVWWNGMDEEGRYILQAILVLPFSDFMISDCGKSIPSHYKINAAGDYVWAEGYKDGQKSAKMRKYLVMCFDGKARHQLVWLLAREFRRLNLQDEHLEHRQDVQDYLALQSNSATLDYLAMRSNAATGPGNEIESGSDDLYDDSQNGDVGDHFEDRYEDSRHGDEGDHFEDPYEDSRSGDVGDHFDDLYEDSRNGDADADSDDGRSETLDNEGGDRTGTTTEIAETPQPDVRAESSAQSSGRSQPWRMARRARYDMMDLDDSDGE